MPFRVPVFASPSSLPRFRVPVFVHQRTDRETLHRAKVTHPTERVHSNGCARHELALSAQRDASTRPRPVRKRVRPCTVRHTVA
jgi:hypothetical protein